MSFEGEETSLTPLAGGKRGETFLATVGGERTVVRIYGRSWARRGDGAAEIDAAALRFVRGLVPVPDVIEVRRGDADNGLPPLLVTSFVEGTRLDSLLPKLREKDLRAVAGRVGIVLARLAQMPMLSAGPFLDGNLRIGPARSSAELLSDWLEMHLERGSALNEWPKADLDALRGHALHCQGLLADVTRRTLVHGDFDSRNLLVDPATLDVTAVVDWENAYAGLPFADLGSALRASTSTLGKRATAFDETILDVFAERVPDALEEKDGPRTSVALDRLHAKARAADLAALIELASNPAMNPTAQAAHDLLLSNVRAFRSQS